MILVTGGRQMEGLAVLVMLFGIFTGIFWMVVGWRAMRAHEKLADSVDQVARRQSSIQE